MSCTRSKIVAQAQSWIGRNEYDGSHKPIIDTYNSHMPLARGYKLKYTDSWCSGFASAVAIACGATDIIPTEVSCYYHIKGFKGMGIWVENDAYVPQPGDFIFYDWNDNSSGDNRGTPDHVGIVEKVENGVITVIEGNYNNAVKRRTLQVNGKYIRGYGVPKYAEEPKKETTTKTCTVNLPILRKGDKGDYVKTLQRLLIARGYNCGSYGADGSFGNATAKALRAYQTATGKTVDEIAGPASWGGLLSGK